MTNTAVLETKISAIQRYLGILEAYKKFTKEQIQKDVTLHGAVERYLYLASQATIDLAEALISYKGFRRPAILKEAFEILKENNIISSELSDKMIGLVGFRNVVAHDYEEINYDIVYDVLLNRLSDIESFIAIVEKQL